MEFISLIKVLFNCGSGVKKSIKIYRELVLRSENFARANNFSNSGLRGDATDLPVEDHKNGGIIKKKYIWSFKLLPFFPTIQNISLCIIRYSQCFNISTDLKAFFQQNILAFYTSAQTVTRGFHYKELCIRSNRNKRI